MKSNFVLLLVLVSSYGSAKNIPIDELPQNSNTSITLDKKYKVTIPKNTVQSESGIAQLIPLDTNLPNAILKYKFIISENFRCNTNTRGGKSPTGKLPGFSGGQKPNTGGLTSEYINKSGWSVRLTYRGCYFESYIYDNQMKRRYNGKSTFGKPKRIEGIRLTHNTTYNVSLAVVMNTKPKKADGKVMITINGKSLTISNLLLNNGIASGPISSIEWNLFNGGGKAWKIKSEFDIIIWDVSYSTRK